MQGKAAAEKAATIGGKTDRERAYIAAIAKFYGDFDQRDHKSRTSDYEKAMEPIYRNHPDDREAAAFYALSLQATANPNDKTYANQLKSAEILEGECNALLFKAGDPADLAAQLSRVFAEPGLADRLRAAGKETVRSRFLGARMVDEIEAHLTEIVGGRRQ